MIFLRRGSPHGLSLAVHYLKEATRPSTTASPSPSLLYPLALNPSATLGCQNARVHSAGKQNPMVPASSQPCRVQRLHSSHPLRCQGASPTRTVFSGIQPTGELHLGNYLGAVKRWVDLQEGGDDVIFCVVDLHSITLPQDPTTLHTQTLSMAASLLACGIDPSRAVLFQQSRVLEHSQLSWVLGCLATMARLGHLPQYKEKSASQKEVPLGLYVYPVLQAADILLYHATHVPVGEDQLQHIQLAAHLARTFNNRFGHTFTPPRPLVLAEDTARLRSLRQPTKKMSKSEADPRGRVALTDPPEVIREKFKKAVTDFTSEVYYDPEARPGVSNMMVIHSAVTGQSVLEVQASSEGLTTAQYKLVVADAVVEHLAPIRRQINDFLQNRDHLDYLLDQGAQRARERAAKTWQLVSQKVGLSGMA